jgi:phenylacetate-CoA ligase
LREQLVARFDCPVLDLYSLNEAGPVAVADERAGGHVLLQHRMFVEILDGDGEPVAPGERGEITLTGGFNSCLPLLRYRTGDHAALDLSGPEPVLVELAGRPPVRFRTARGEWINNIEVTRALGRFALPQFRVHQDAAGRVRLAHAGSAALHGELAAAMRALFGPGLSLEVVAMDPAAPKCVQYTSDLAGALA